MAIKRTEDKRLQALKNQLYGASSLKPNIKVVESDISYQPGKSPLPHQSFTTPAQPTHPTTLNLKQDLLKILTLAALSVTIQLSLWFMVNHQLIKL